MFARRCDTAAAAGGSTFGMAKSVKAFGLAASRGHRFERGRRCGALAVAARGQRRRPAAVRLAVVRASVVRRLVVARVRVGLSRGAVRYQVVLSLAMVAAFGQRRVRTLGRDVVGVLAAVVTPVNREIVSQIN